MNFLRRLLSVTSELETPTKIEEVSFVEHYVERHKDDKWQRFGKGYPTQEQAVSALIDWQAFWPQDNFRIASGEASNVR